MRLVQQDYHYPRELGALNLSGWTEMSANSAPSQLQLASRVRKARGGPVQLPPLLSRASARSFWVAEWWPRLRLRARRIRRHFGRMLSLPKGGVALGEQSSISALLRSTTLLLRCGACHASTLKPHDRDRKPERAQQCVRLDGDSRSDLPPTVPPSFRPPTVYLPFQVPTMDIIYGICR